MLQLLSHQFVQYAFIAGTLISIICAIVGYFVVLRVQAFAAESLSCVGFTGATGAAIFGVSSLTGAFLFTVLVALGFGLMGKRLKGRDIEIGMVLSFALGLGVLLLKLYTSNATEAVGILFGSILSVTTNDLYLSLSTGIIALTVLGFIFRPLLFASIDSEIAEARGVPIQFLGVLFMLLLGVTIAEAILVVGVLLVFALLIAPAATAQHITHRPITSICLSVALGVVFIWGGMFLGLFFHLPVSFFIAALAAITYLTTVPLVHIISPHVYNQVTSESE
ncbi:MAG TPA: metal ABC transporter permease [Patescibacteria group bacterium]|nr:metal ABC transporter permease [Patescibacteria group bacterium]